MKQFGSFISKAGSIECNTCGYRTQAPRDPEWLPTHADAVWGNLNAKDQPRGFDLDELRRIPGRCPLWSGRNDLPQDHCRGTNGNRFKETQGFRLSASSLPFVKTTGNARITNGVNPAFQPPTFESQAQGSPSYWCHPSVNGNGSTNESINQPVTSGATIGSCPNPAGKRHLMRTLFCD